MNKYSLARSADENAAENQQLGNLPDKLNPDFDATERVATIIQGAFNLACTSMHGTILTLPFIFQSCGLVVTTGIILIFSIVTSVTLVLLCRSVRKCAVSTLPDLMEQISGLKCQLLFTSFVLSIKFALMVGSLILLRQIGTDIFLFFHYFMVDRFVLLIGIVLAFPFMLFNNILRIRYLSYFGFAAIVFVLINMLIISCIFIVKHSDSLSVTQLKLWPGDFPAVLSSIPLVAMLYIPKFGIMDIFSQLREPTPERTMTLINTTIGMMTFMYLSLGIVGYLAIVYLFENVPEDNIIHAFPVYNNDMITSRCLMFLFIVCSLPFMVISGRNYIVGFKNQLQGIMHETMSGSDQQNWDGDEKGGSVVDKKDECVTQQNSIKLSECWQSPACSLKCPQPRRPPSYYQLESGYVYDGDETGSGDVDESKSGGHLYATIRDSVGHREHTPLKPLNTDTLLDTEDMGCSTLDTEGFQDSVRSSEFRYLPNSDMLDTQHSGKYKNKRDAFEPLEGIEKVGSISTKTQRGSGIEGMKQAEQQSQQQQQQSSMFRKDNLKDLALTIVMVACAFAAADVLPNRVSLVWQVAGSLVVMPITVFVPPLIYILLAEKMHVHKDNYTYAAYVLEGVVIPVVLACSYWNIAKLVK